MSEGKMKKPFISKLIVSVVFLSLSQMALGTWAKEPNCSTPDGWAASIVLTNLKNAGIVEGSEIDFKRTLVSKISSEKIKKDLFRQVHLVEFYTKKGQKIQAIAINDASKDECSETGVDVFLIEKQFGLGPLKLQQKLKEEKSK